MPYSSKSRQFRDALVTILTGVQLNGEPAFGLVTGDPSAEFSAEPYALVYPGPMDSVKMQVGQNDRTVNFSVLLLLQMENAQRTQPETYNYMYDLTELVLDTLDEGDFIDILNTVDGNLGTWLMNASRGTFIPADTKTGAALLSTIDVAITYSKNL